MQAAFKRAKEISNPLSTGAVLCGQKEMTEVRYYCNHLSLSIYIIMKEIFLGFIKFSMGKKLLLSGNW